MDINQSSLNQYKNNKPGIARSLSGQKASSETKVNQSNTPIEQLNLKEGQILKGQIIDQRYNEVRIRLEPGKQTILARVAGDIPLSIGQEAQFQVSDVGSNLTLKYLPSEGNNPGDAAIAKILNSAGFSMTENNKAIAAELLSHRMPVDRQTLQTLIRASFQNREASPLTLVLMLKNNIPLTSENIKQFMAYQKGNAKVLNDMNQIAKNITELLFPENPEEMLLQEGNQNPLRQAIEQNAKLINILYPEQATDNSSSQARTLSSPNEESQPTTLFLNNQQGDKNSGGSSPFAGQLQEGTTASRNFATSNTLITSTGSENTTTRGILAESMISESTTTKATSAESMPSESTTSKSIPAEVATINSKEQQSATLSDNTISNTVLSNKSISSTLSMDGITPSPLMVQEVLLPKELSNLLELMNNLPLRDELKEQLTANTLPLKTLLQELQQVLSSSSLEAQDGLSLLHRPEYGKLLESALLQRWTLTPDNLYKKSSVKELYQKLQEDMEQLTSLSKLANTKQEQLSTSSSLKNLNENLQFMKDLNESYTYLQLPTQFKDNQMHTDLYVFTNKKAMKEKPGQLSVLLHLDMEHLGELNIHVQMNQQNIQAKFTPQDAQVSELLQKNIPLLEEALKQKGYYVHAEVEANYAKPDFINDFIEEKSADSKVQRYTFDIRT